MPIRSCPDCRRRLPYAARRCLHCGLRLPLERDFGRQPAWGRARPWVLVAMLLGVLAGGLIYGNLASLAYWYAGFAARHLPASLSSFGPTDTDAGAFFFCARQVAKRIDDRFSVETFPSLAESTAVTLGERRYRIYSFVDEIREAGAPVRHAFVCTVRHERGRWMLEELQVE